jgi:hypothetical protein
MSRINDYRIAAPLLQSKTPPKKVEKEDRALIYNPFAFSQIQLVVWDVPNKHLMLKTENK